MSLLNLRTDLKSLKYGSDRPDGGDSGLPFIKTDINKVDRGFNRFRLTRFDDGLIRGGVVGALNASVVDTLRIAKFLTHAPQGPLFIAKQVGLQLSNPKLETKGLRTNRTGFFGDIINAANKINNLVGPTRIYNLGINTLAQIPVTAFGLHFNRHGLLPIQSEDTKYQAVVNYNNENKNNRLVGLTNKFKLGDRQSNFINKKTFNFLNNLFGFIEQIARISLPKLTPEQLIIDKYIAGPGSIYGIGNTTINRYSFTEDKTKIEGAINRSKQLAGQSHGEDDRPLPVNYTSGLGTGNNAVSKYGSKSIRTDNTGIQEGINNNAVKYTNVLGSVGTYAILKTKIENQQKLANTKNQFGLYSDANTSISKGIGRAILGPAGIKTGKDISGFSTNNIGKIVYTNTYGEKVIINKSSWNAASRDVRIGSGRKDSINLTPLFTAPIGQDSLKVKIGGKIHTINDLVRFRIQAIDTINPSSSTHMVFRAYITSLEDSVNAGWDGIKYVGRGEEFYVYNGFTRKINMSFKVAALSSSEMEPMYQKLNYLMSNMMPDYSSIDGTLMNGTLMKGPFIRMTVGNWIDSQPGIITSLTYSVSNDSPWEIALNEPTAGGAREMVLPHVVEVSLSFTPIGVQTKGTDQLAQKSHAQSNIAQNWNGSMENSNYINSNVIKQGYTS